MNFYLPDGMRIINKIEAKIRVGSFRAYSKATDTEDAHTSTSTSGGGSTQASTSGGGSTQTTTAGGGQTSSATALESSNVLPNQTTGQAVHNHGIPDECRIAIVDESNNVIGGKNWVPSGAHTHPEHTHNVQDHSHSVTIPSHNHNVTIPSHSHNVTIPAHGHEITPGIYFYGSPKTFGVYVNGTKRLTINGTDAEIDLTNYLTDADTAMIPRGTWHSVEIRPDDLAYVSMDMYIQGFVQSRGDATV